MGDIGNGVRSAIKNVGDVVNAGVSGASDAYKANQSKDKQTQGFNDPFSNLQSGLKSYAYGAVKAAQKARDIIMPPSQNIQKNILPNIQKNILPKAPALNPAIKSSLDTMSNPANMIQKKSVLKTTLQKNTPPTSSNVSALPKGWDRPTYSNFKKSNPSLEPTAQDTAKMKNAK